MVKNQQNTTHTSQSTQDYIDLGEIRDGIVITKEGGLRMVMIVSAINFDLKSEREQNALVGQYQNFLNSLSFPIQIIMQSRRLDLNNYLEKLRQRSLIEKNQLIKIQTEDYMAFIKRLLTIANIMDKKFYLVLPYNPPNIQSRGFFDKVLHPTTRMLVKISPQEFKHFKQELTERANTVMSGLGSLGIRAIPLNTQQIIELFYSSYNIEEATKEKLINATELEAPLVEKKQENLQK